MSIDLFKLYKDEGATGLCLVTGGAIELGAVPMEVTYTELPAEAGAGATDMHLVVKAGEALKYSKVITSSDKDLHKELDVATEYVLRLEGNYAAVRAELERTTEYAQRLEKALAEKG